MAEAKKVATIKTPVSDTDKAKRAAEKASKFVEVVQKRVAKAIQSIRLIGNLASPNYVYTSEQVDKVISGLQTEVDSVYEAFKAKKSKEKVSFTL
jgi:adenosylmethionine-8-amino-7-oxononanoate aminotransferase